MCGMVCFCRTFEYLGKGTEITVSMFWVACVPAYLLWAQSTASKAYFSVNLFVCNSATNTKILSLKHHEDWNQKFN